MSAESRVTDRAREILVQSLDNRVVGAPDYWDFSSVPARSGGHAYFQYPAMMVPELQGALLTDLQSAVPDASLIYDPFMGSGTVMLESIYRGLDFHGSDINPMAVLLSSVKSDPPRTETITHSLRSLLAAARAYRRVVPPEFLGRDKWFNPEVSDDLARLRRAIQMIDSLMLRRFLWVCLAETVRIVSNSRTSTFKLHIYAEKQSSTRTPDAMKTFELVTKTNAKHAGLHWAAVNARDKAMSNPHTPQVTLLRGSVEDKWTAPRLADALMTSPPYGDNRTTVPYGQHSYLPLVWIDHKDLPGTFDPDLLVSTARIDSLSLGGSIVGADKKRLALASIAPSLEQFVEGISDVAPLRKKVLSFASDYSQALTSSSARLRSGAFSFWTLGERRVDRKIMPLVSVTQEILESLGHAHVTTITRRLPLGRKRMAVKNRLGDTMGTEQILVMQKGEGAR